MAIKFLSGARNADQKISDIITSASYIDEALSEYISGYFIGFDFQRSHLIASFEKLILEELKYAEKVKIVANIFPNNSNKKIEKFHWKLIRIGEIRNEVAHKARFIFNNEPELLLESEKTLDELYIEFERLIKEFESFVSVIQGGWDYREEYLYGR